MGLKDVFKRFLTYVFKGVPVKNVIANIITVDKNEILKGKNALITGGSDGIGRSICQAFLEAGCNVIITGRNEDKLKGVVDEFDSKYNGRILYYILDNKKVDLFKKAVEDIFLLMNGRIDILVNNAGQGGGNISRVTSEEFDSILETNLKGSFFLSKYICEMMIENQIQGNVLMIASSSSLRPAISAYELSKWGIRGLTMGLAKKYIKNGIVVNGIAPGPTATSMLKKSAEGNLARSNSPIGRYILPKEIANAAVFLVSDMGRTIVGDIIYMTGGAGVITFDDVNY